MKKKVVIALALLVLFAGAGVMSYPMISNWINEWNGSYAIQVLQKEVNDADKEELARQLQLAQEYNKNPENPSVPYENILNYHDGMMGYIQIPAIDVHLPIYHGVSEMVLSKGIGHLPESAFPVGGEGNHAVLTGHTGLPGAYLFTDLIKMKEGDEFFIQILEEKLTYRVDQILVVLSHETEALAREDGKDYCTLVTCTPYGVNSHRLLVRGERVLDIPAPEPEHQVDRFSVQWTAVFVGAGILVAVFLAVILAKRRKGHGA